MSPRNSLYSRVLDITEDYLGPAAPRFLQRLVLNHLGKPAEKITKEDLPQLVVWIKLATTMITSDQSSVNEFMRRLEELVDKQENHISNGQQRAIA